MKKKLTLFATLIAMSVATFKPEARAQTRRADACRVLMNPSGYELGPLVTRPDWHDVETGEAHPRDQAHPVLCPEDRCALVQLVLREWTSPDDPDIELAQNPDSGMTDTFFATRCVHTADGLTCSIQMLTASTTTVNVARYNFARRNGQVHQIRGTIRASYRGQPICVTQIGPTLYAIEVPLLSTTGAVIGHHGWCEVYSHP